MIEQFISYIVDKTKPYIIFDIGSRDCMQSIEFYKAFPNAKIYAFECNPKTLDLCKRNIQSYTDRITLIEGAVCDYDGTITFYPINQQKTTTTWKDGNPGASSLFKSNGTYTVENYVQDEIKTSCHRLDTVMKKYTIPRADILWMDLQGAELLALKGLGEAMNNVQYIHTEVSHKEMYTGQVMFEELHNFIVSKQFTLKNILSLRGWQEDAIYQNMNISKSSNEFDIVIPVGPKDIDVIQKQLEYTKANIIGYRNIYLVYIDNSLQVDGCITVTESAFPFSIETVAGHHGKRERNGWYLQQLIKLYAGFVIEGILDRYLVIDSDTFFLKPTTFVEDGKCLYNTGIEYHRPYFEHMSKLSNEFIKKIKTMSGICHHMIFEKKYVKEIFDIVESKHGDTFYNVFLKLVSTDVLEKSGASEYELYFNYIISKHSNKIILRPLKTMGISTLNFTTDCDYVSYHWHVR